MDYVNPISGEKLGEVESSSSDQIFEIYKDSQAAQLNWSQRSLKNRAKVLNHFADVLYRNRNQVAQELSALNGKTPFEALVYEVYPTISNFKYFSKVGPSYLKPKKIMVKPLYLSRSEIRFEPLGSIGVISPWNYPLLLALQNVPAALMAGNSIIIKPSEFAVGIGVMIESLVRQAELPKGLVQIIYGGADQGKSLISSGIRLISFVGSTKTGEQIYQQAARERIPCLLELGGKDVAVVLNDADVESTVEGLVWGGFANCGQTCAGVETVFVPQSKLANYKKAIVDFAESLPASDVGVMNNKQQLEIVDRQVSQAQKAGAEVIKIEKTSPSLSLSYPMTLVVEPSRDLEIVQEETFGPVINLLGYENEQDAIEFINSGKYGLTSSVWGKNSSNTQKVADRLSAGTVTINDHMITAGFAEAPWGGVRDSGLGFSHSYLSLYHFVQKKYLYDDRGLMPFKFWRFPHSNRKKRFFDSFIKSQFEPSVIKRIYYSVLCLPKIFFKDKSDTP